MTGRETAFPGIYISEMEVQKPPFDEEGVIQDFVGRGAIKDFELLQRAADFSEENIQDTIESLEEVIGPLRDTFRLTYHLKVKAVTDSMFTERGVSVRARTYVRSNNPFSTDNINVSEPTVDRTLSSEDIGTVYDVYVTVVK